MTTLQGGSHSRFYDGVLEENAQKVSIYWLELAIGQSDRTPAPNVQYKLYRGHLPVPIPLPRFPGVITYLERHLEPLQLETLGEHIEYTGGTPPTPFTQCERYRRKVPPWRLNNLYYDLDKRRLGEEWWRQRDINQHYFEASSLVISVHLESMDTTAAYYTWD